MDVRDIGGEAYGVDAGGVREPCGAVDQGEPGDRSSVEAEQLQCLVRAIDVRRRAQRRSGLLHLDDHRQ
ncbi:MAG: hypothetical protein AUH33_02270 [Chloroflexi bacterium 13_1_40CM_68_21]|nr:MAG: hypothetical protein AUH33_02270 [Chloroflexi bacterium 13_1_40CM_68_21]